MRFQVSTKFERCEHAQSAFPNNGSIEYQQLRRTKYDDSVRKRAEYKQEETTNDPWTKDFKQNFTSVSHNL
ncbi:hypothetical protein CJ030_MR6G004345 [Morella rubra]|uniref:Uncharacterized protein n=1 Tax=Morella rubra TaxID=262757 RepID=A0A6A1VAU0_9ROSI|nr:hypothetical protein CJ030_MR6G004345 [Morella rubra]